MTESVDRPERDETEQDEAAGGPKGLQFLLADEPEPEVRQIIHREIRAFNDAVSRNHRAVRASGRQPLEITLRDEQERLLGGLVGDTYWEWLGIDDLWLHESLRGCGHGRRLMVMAEAEAQARGCSRAFVRTFSFQARGFYEKMGYRLVGRLDDYPPGETFFWMRKELSPPASA